MARQNKKEKMPYLFSVASVLRPNLQDFIRGKIIEECQALKNFFQVLMVLLLVIIQIM
jgi:hypothetical protein